MCHPFLCLMLKDLTRRLLPHTSCLQRGKDCLAGENEGTERPTLKVPPTLGVKTGYQAEEVLLPYPYLNYETRCWQTASIFSFFVGVCIFAYILERNSMLPHLSTAVGRGTSLHRYLLRGTQSRIIAAAVALAKANNLPAMRLTHRSTKLGSRFRALARPRLSPAISAVPPPPAKKKESSTRSTRGDKVAAAPVATLWTSPETR